MIVIQYNMPREGRPGRDHLLSTAAIPHQIHGRALAVTGSPRLRFRRPSPAQRQSWAPKLSASRGNRLDADGLSRAPHVYDCRFVRQTGRLSDVEAGA